MSVQSEIQRIQASKNTLKEVLIEKGVSVPEDAKLPDLVRLVEQVEGEQSIWSNEDITNMISNRQAITTIAIPDGTTEIDEYAFAGLYNLELVKLPEGLLLIGDNSFYNCAKLVFTSLPESLEDIDPYAFSHCKKLSLTSLPQNLKSIGVHSFAYCTGITNIRLPQSLERLDYAFYSCSNLKTATFEGTPASIHKSVFSKCNNLITINVPWSEDDPINVDAPWGAVNATINYNYTGE